MKLLVAEGESVPGPILEIGNTNPRYTFGLGARQFVNDWKTHAPPLDLRPASVKDRTEKSDAKLSCHGWSGGHFVGASKAKADFIELARMVVRLSLDDFAPPPTAQRQKPWSILQEA